MMISLIRSDAFGPLDQRPDRRRRGRGAGSAARTRRALRVDRGHPSKCGARAPPRRLCRIHSLHVPVRAPPRDPTALTTAPRYADAPTSSADGVLTTAGCSPRRGAHHDAPTSSADGVLTTAGCSPRRPNLFSGWGAHHGGVLTTTPQPLQRMGCGLRARKECSPRRLARFPTGPRRRERELLLGAPSSSSGADGAAPRRELPDHLHASAHHGAALEPRRELPDHLDAALTTALTDAEARAIRQMATGTYLLLSKRGDDHLMVT
jgi:hypothetical protein